jgi:molybdate transport system ATP-binding protein
VATFDLELQFTQGTFDVNVAVRCDGRVLAFYGPSGSGKTTTLELIAGIRTPVSGRVSVAGHDYYDSARGIDIPIRERRIGYVPQDILLFPHMTVRDNVAYGYRGGDGNDMARIVDLLEIGSLLTRNVQRISGGERQRVALARALNASPRVLLLDEPLAAVDLARRAKIVAALTRVRDELMIPIVYVAHAQDEVRALADVVVTVDDGRVVAVGPPNEVLP